MLSPVSPTLSHLQLTNPPWTVRPSLLPSVRSRALTTQHHTELTATFTQALIDIRSRLPKELRTPKVRSSSGRASTARRHSADLPPLHRLASSAVQDYKVSLKYFKTLFLSTITRLKALDNRLVRLLLERGRERYLAPRRARLGRTDTGF